jgi:CheY-like chemotaxis protein
MYRLMLADDSEATQKIVTLAFKDTNYQVICLSNGVDVLEYISHSPVDIMLIDVDLPGIDGYQLCETMLKDPQTADLPVVLLGSIKCPVDEDRVRDYPSSAKLEKPFETSQLLELVDQLLSDQGQQSFISRSDKGTADVQEILFDAVAASICPDIRPDTAVIAGLGVDQLQAETKIMPRQYLGHEETAAEVSGRSLSEKEYSMVVDLVLEKISGSLKSVVPEAADEVLKKNR